MNNKNLMIGGILLVGILAYYFYDKNKRNYIPLSSQINPSGTAGNRALNEEEIKKNKDFNSAIYLK